MIFDTHAHYDDSLFDEDRDEVLAGLPAAAGKAFLPLRRRAARREINPRPTGGGKGRAVHVRSHT